MGGVTCFDAAWQAGSAVHYACWLNGNHVARVTTSCDTQRGDLIPSLNAGGELERLLLPRLKS